MNRHDVGEDGRSLREGARLVEDHRIDFGERFEVASTLHENALFGAVLHGSENGERRGEPQGARVVDHEDRGRAGEVSREEEDEAREEEVVGDDGVGKTLGLPLNARLCGFAVLNEVDDLREPRGVAERRRTNVDFAVFNHGAGKDAAARFAMNGERFARHGRLVDGGVAGCDHAVDRNDGTGADDDEVFLREGIELLLGELPVGAADPDLIDLDGELVGKRREGLLSRIALEHVAEAEEQREKTHRSEVEPQERNKNRGGVEHRDVELAPEGILHAFNEIGDRIKNGVPDIEHHREEGPQEDVAGEAGEIELGILFLKHGGFALVALKRRLPKRGSHARRLNGSAREAEKRREDAGERIADFRKDAEHRHVGEATLDRKESLADETLRARALGEHFARNEPGRGFARFPAVLGHDERAARTADRGIRCKAREICGGARLRGDVFNGERDAARKGIHFKTRDAGNLRKLFGDDDAARVREGASGLPAFTVADRVLQIELHLLFAYEKPSSMSPDPLRGTRRAGFAKKLARAKRLPERSGDSSSGGRFFNGYREAFCLD